MIRVVPTNPAPHIHTFQTLDFFVLTRLLRHPCTPSSPTYLSDDCLVWIDLNGEAGSRPGARGAIKSEPYKVHKFS